MKQKEVLQKATSFFHRYREGNLSLNEILKEIERTEQKTREALKGFLLSQWIDALSLKDDAEKILKGIESLKRRSMDQVKQKFHHLLSQYQKQKKKDIFFTNQDIYLLREGNHFNLYNKLGAHPLSLDGEEGTQIKCLSVFVRRRSLQD
jgi:ATP-dependent Clp protease ATP-binding subunit ClpA